MNYLLGGFAILVGLVWWDIRRALRLDRNERIVATGVQEKKQKQSWISIARTRGWLAGLFAYTWGVFYFTSEIVNFQEGLHWWHIPYALTVIFIGFLIGAVLASEVA